MCEKKCTLGIFSRDHRNCYQWLSESLENLSAVQSVNHCYISNSFSAFRDKVRNCTFAILYHTKNRGRLNITNVTDSLYDEELKYLHDKLGKKNVIVVVDDVEDEEDQKSQIQKDQPSIRKLAHAMFLFSEMDKMVDSSEDSENSSLITSSNMKEKLKQMTSIMQDHNRRLWWKNYAYPIIFFAVFLLMVAIWLVVYEED